MTRRTERIDRWPGQRSHFHMILAVTHVSNGNETIREAVVLKHSDTRYGGRVYSVLQQ